MHPNVVLNLVDKLALTGMFLLIVSLIGSLFGIWYVSKKTMQVWTGANTAIGLFLLAVGIYKIWT